MNLNPVEFEQSVIGACLLGQSHDNAEGLKAEHFASDQHRAAFAEILKAWEKGEQHDCLTLAQALGDDFAYWGELANNAAPSMFNAYARHIKDAAVRREMVRVADSLHAMALERGDTLEKINAASESIAGLAAGEVRKGARHVSDVLITHMETMTARIDGELSGYSTGFVDLDKMVRFRGSNVIVIAARPSMGKTSLAMQFAMEVASHAPVLCVSQEMSEGELSDRLISSKSRIPMPAVISGHMSDEQHGQMSYGVSVLRSLDLHIDDSPNQSLAEIRANARAIHRKKPLGMIVVDYLQLMSGDGDNRNLEVEKLSRGFKGMAKEFDCPVVLLSQLNRQLENRPNKRPQMSDLRDSGAIEQDADVVLMIYRDEVYNPGSADAGTAEILVRKNRQGKTGVVRLAWQGEYTSFGDCAWQESQVKPEDNTRPFAKARSKSGEF